MANYSNIFVNEALSYANYRDLIDFLLKEGKTTGTDHSDSMLQYTSLNVQRMNRIEKSVVLSEVLVEAIQKLRKNYLLLVISEGWCGDAAQIVPLFKKMAEIEPKKFDLRFILRDEHLSLMDQYLTNGGRAIPVLLVMDTEGEVICKWGPRPAILQQLLQGWRITTPEHDVWSEKLHLWYARDRTHTTQLELTALVENLEQS
ncbi:thioredoxin family protein [Pedobacter sp. L105]|uniref:thioredoxin family protein n=1 Tax=Pedobacter sp. L105 TaxID=1641871 RepID=UPI00131B0AA1|nr:thioredoxin family protein [Pedobacter sp. L105]